jgi:chemotaxis protein MotB
VSGATAKSNRHQGETIVKKVSRRGHDDDHGGNWKVAFADFCLALLCLFLVLWILSARDADEARARLHISEVYEGSSGIFDGQAETPPHPQIVDPIVFQPPTADGGEPGDVLREIDSDEDLRKLAAALEHLAHEAHLENNLQAVITPAGLRVMLHDTHRQGIFDRGSANVDTIFDELMQRMGQLFAQIGNPLVIVGHTDSLAFRDPMVRSNWHLSAERAMAARSSLLKGGMPVTRLFQVVGMADRAPLEARDPASAINRRIEFLVLTKKRAHLMEQMFGTPKATAPLMDGVNAVVEPGPGPVEDA